jgi:glycerol-3-phosphate acyltransferase PlsY
LLAYLVGSTPTGFLVAKARGVDIRAVGSGNIGATNVFRVLGVPAGTFVMVADAAKGWFSAKLVAKWAATVFLAGYSDLTVEWLALCAGFGAVLGHNYTCWLRFKGGKGISTSAGVLLAIVPVPLMIILTVFVIVLATTRYVSLASMAASFTLPFATWLTGRSGNLIGVTAAMAVLAIYKHKANIKRLIQGTESRVGGKQPLPAASNQTR